MRKLLSLPAGVHFSPCNLQRGRSMRDISRAPQRVCRGFLPPAFAEADYAGVTVAKRRVNLRVSSLFFVAGVSSQDKTDLSCDRN